MNLKKYKSLLSLTTKNIVRRRLRSTLTILAVMIGIAAVVALVLLSNGLFNSIQGQFDKIGANTIFVLPITLGGGAGSPNAGTGQRLGDNLKLTMEDVKDIERISGITEVIPMSFLTSKIEFNRQEQYQLVFIVEADLANRAIEIFDQKIREGTGLIDKQGQKVLIGSDVADVLFDRQIKAGDVIKIDGRDFKVVGILEASGDPQNDGSIFMLRETASNLYPIGNDVSEIVIKTNTQYDPIVIKDKIQTKLDKTHPKNTIMVITANQILAIIKSVLNVLKIILTAIAGISIVVGAIGIMNSIYTSVLERTKEIGVLKAIGAKPKDINFIFISESIILSLVGGVLGLGFGILIAKGVEWYTISQGINMLSIVIGPSIIILGIGLAVVTGVFAGILPARRAKHMNTVDALKNKY